MSRFLRPVLVLLAVVTVGSIAYAASASVKYEAENGSLLGGAAAGTDAQAAGGRYVAFSQASGGCPVGQVGTPPNCLSASSALGVDARTSVHAFDARMKGFGLGNWTFNFGRPYINEVQGLGQLVQAINPGLIRYAGGLKANYVGFNRAQKTPVFDSAWTLNGQTYYERYGTDELASLDAFAKNVGAQVIIQVNLSNNDPSMWADLVRYAQEKGWTSFKYYELSNELDLESFQNSSDKMDPATYGNRVKAYQQAMLAVDSSIKIVGGVPATATDIMYQGYSGGGNQVSSFITQALSGAKSAGRDLSAVSFHWYQNSGNDVANTFNYTYGNPTTSGDWWRESYSRGWAAKVGPWIRSTAMSAYPNAELGMSEINVDSADGIVANGNHVGAVWFSDVLGRMAYSGIDWATEWDGYVSGVDEYFGLFYGDSGALKVRPTYYAYLMYNKYFGDQMVKSSSTDDGKISIWASKDSKDPGKLKLRITNMTGSAITTPVALAGFSATGGNAYVMSSSNPTDTSQNGTTPNAGTTINGVKINAMNVASSLASIQPTAVAASGTTFNYMIPAYSSAAVILNGSF
jgi:hypothetical protein